MVDFIRLTMPDMTPIIVQTKDVARIIPRLTGNGSSVKFYKQEGFTVRETPAEIGEMLGAACAASPSTATKETPSKPVHFTAQDVRDLCNGVPSYMSMILRHRGAIVEWPEGDVS